MTFQLTNATKALIIAAMNALLGVAVAFGIQLTVQQLGAIDVAMNAILALIVALTYKDSPNRVSDDVAPSIRAAATSKAAK